MAQSVKNLPAMQKTWVQSLGQEDPLEKEMATHSSMLAWSPPGFSVHGVTKSQTRLSHYNQEPSPFHCMTLPCEEMQYA